MRLIGWFNQPINDQISVSNNIINNNDYLRTNNVFLDTNKQRKVSKLETVKINPKGQFYRSIDDQKVKNNGIDLRI